MAKTQNISDQDLTREMGSIEDQLEVMNEEIKGSFPPLEGLRSEFKVYYMDLTDEAWEGRLDHVNPQRLTRARELQTKCLELLTEKREIEEELYRRAYAREAEQYHQDSLASQHQRGPIR